MRDDGTRDGGVPDEDAPAGVVRDGDAPAGDLRDGDAPARDLRDGDAPDEDAAAAGEVRTGHDAPPWNGGLPGNHQVAADEVREKASGMPSGPGPRAGATVRCRAPGMAPRGLRRTGPVGTRRLHRQAPSAQANRHPRRVTPHPRQANRHPRRGARRPPLQANRRRPVPGNRQRPALRRPGRRGISRGV